MVVTHGVSESESMTLVTARVPSGPGSRAPSLTVTVTVTNRVTVSQAQKILPSTVKGHEDPRLMSTIRAAMISRFFNTEHIFLSQRLSRPGAGTQDGHTVTFSVCHEVARGREKKRKEGREWRKCEVGRAEARMVAGSKLQSRTPGGSTVSSSRCVAGSVEVGMGS